MAQKVTPREKDYGRWYTDIIQMAELIDYGPVRGTMVIRANGYSIWEKMKEDLDGRIKATGHKNVYFPLLIPESFLKKEAEHVEGFAPECAVVTHAGGKKLEEPLVIRPTSETMIWHMYQKWISSYRDLPLLYNQWANVVRWEMRARPFLRTTEFLWQEGHTAHATEKEAIEEAQKMHLVYRDFMQDTLGIPLILGRKTENEKFAGAVDTYTIEALMQDGKALQMGTSHYLGQNFAKAFDVKFQDQNGELTHVYATSWGVSTRMIGGLIMTHSDDQGLVLPPNVAATKVVIVPIWKDDKEPIRNFVKSLDIDAHFDDREGVKPGFKFNEWEMKGIPIRLEVGPRDLANNQVVLARRDTKEKLTVSVDQIKPTIEKLLVDIQNNLFNRAKERMDEHTFPIDSYDAFKAQAEHGGFILAHWCGDTLCEKKIATETKATIRCIPLDNKKEEGSCIRCKNPSHERVVFARAY